MAPSLSIPTDAGAGANLKSPAWFPKDLTQSLENGLPKGIPEQMQRALAVAAYFFSGVVAINTSQMLAAPMSAINNDWYEGWLSLTKQSFGILTTTMTQFWAPTVMRVSGDASVRGQLMKTEDGDLVCNFPDRLVLIANHQIYTDWLYLWWVAYTAGKHGNVYIILKESLKKIPVIGWGMQLNKFIFLKRNWEADKPHLLQHMQRLNKLAEPMWLMLFPEGTNLAPDTRIKSRKWAAKNRLKDMQHTLLPRSTGLRFCLQELRSSVGYVYDCTVAYSGVPRGKYAQDIYTLRASYLEGRPPKSVNMYWRRFKVSDIPLDNALAFESWLLARWREKDNLIEYYYKYGKFPADTGVSMGPRGEFLRGAGHIESEVRANKWRDFLQVFAPMGMLALVLFMFYGALPKEMIDAIGGQAGKIGQEVEEKVGPKKLLAFDGTGFKQISAGSKEFGNVVKQGLSRSPVRRAGSVSSMSSGPRGRADSVFSASTGLASTGNSVAQSRARAPPSTTQSEPKKLLGFGGGKFREVSPARSIASARTATTRNTAPATNVASVVKAKEEKKKLLGFAGDEYREVSNPTVQRPATNPSRSTSQTTPQPSKLTAQSTRPRDTNLTPKQTGWTENSGNGKASSPTSKITPQARPSAQIKSQPNQKTTHHVPQPTAARIAAVTPQASKSSNGSKVNRVPTQPPTEKRSPKSSQPAKPAQSTRTATSTLKNSTTSTETGGSKPKTTASTSRIG